MDITRANEITIENSKTGKMTAVVVILKVFGDTSNNSRNANPGKSLCKPSRKLNLKKKGLNRSFNSLTAMVACVRPLENKAT